VELTFCLLANDPFNNTLGFLFPPTEDLTLSYLPHLLVAQAFIPPTERTEAAVQNQEMQETRLGPNNVG